MVFTGRGGGLWPPARNMFNLSIARVFQVTCFRTGFPPSSSALALRTVATTQQDAKISDMPIKMDNPYKQPQKGCILCNVSVDFKNVQLLSQFISPHTGRIYGRHITGLCGQKQREVTKAIKRARSLGFMSVTLKDPQFMKDPNICDIKHLE
ncbi:28S ribosomal protein S18c, mitochondrial [Astyanax mexicanus]|uniref:Small ribosomal subunit protein bS18m n=1 Tax=Astyanax mexicanus TaxID=7994 RepID=A0A8B9KGJ0_ASTMX|nr:28S ribosomal protein S18c, mitochondrial [Astyanax mexicanus]KAG9265509.1 28S ribosomal protein S18c, mitochondrial [Astyanax mexicanus]